MSANPKRRMRGACSQCSRSKRKCDRSYPRCSQCVKQGQICHLQTFKISTPSLFDGRQPDHYPSSSSRVRHACSSPVRTLRPTPSGIEPSPSGTEPSRDWESADLGGDQGDFLYLGSDTPATEPSSSLVPFSDVDTDRLFGDLDFTQLPDFSVSPDVLRVDRDSRAGFAIQPQSAGENASYLAAAPAEAMALPAVESSLPPFVPDRLYCPMPWPDDMLASSERRFLWQYFLALVETDFLCLDWPDVGHLHDFQHPYATTVPQMALSSTPLRGAIFCYSASQYQIRNNTQDFARVKYLTSAEAASAMRTHVTSRTDDAGSLLSMILAATLLYLFGPERHDYVRMASQLVASFRETWTSPPHVPTSFPEISLTEFRWSVISTLCSLQQPSRPLGEEVCRLIEMGDDEVNKNYSRAFQSWVSHPIYAFSPRLVNPLLRIGRLLERQLSQLAGADGPEADATWETQAAEAEEMLLRARECDVSTSKSLLGSADPAAVLALNESMYAAGAILLHARVYGLSFTAPFIRCQAQIVVDEISKIRSDSRVSYAIVFPLFVAGCEAVEPQLRDAIKERLRQPQGVSYYRGDMAGALDEIWRVRDLDPGLRWPQWVNKIDHRYRINCLM